MKKFRDVQPLTEEQFNTMRMVLAVKHSNIEYFNSMSYDLYLRIRKALVERFNVANASVSCMVDPDHRVTMRWHGGDVSITEDAATGDLIETDLSGDCEVTCEKGCMTDYGCNWEDYERLVNDAYVVA